MKAYSAYKPAKIEWVGKIPSHWELKPIRAIFEERKESNTGPKTDFILSVMKDVGVIPYEEKGDVGNKKSDDIERYNIVHPGDLVLNKMNVIIGSVGISDFYGALSPVYIILYPREFKRNDHRFLGYLFKVKPFQRSLRKIANGILEIRESIKRNEFKKITLPLPYFEEQQRIADFLDQKTAEIDDAIAKKQRLVELLEERKVILINQAVTKGLNPDVPMKDSGVEWLGEIPEHWGINMAKFIFRQMDYGLSESAKSEGEYHYLNMGHILNGRVILDNSSFLEDVPQNLLLEKFDLVYNRTNSFALVGKSGIFLGNKEDKVTFASYLVRFRVNENIDPQWANYLINEVQFLEYIRSLALRSLHQANLNPNRFRAVHIPVPPKEEQLQISQELNGISEEYEHYVNHVRATINTYEEMKKVLISEAVTGKIKI